MPSEENGHRPKILEGQFFYMFVMLLIGVKLLSLISFQEFLKAEIFNKVSRDDIVVLTNKARQEQGLPELTSSQTLQEVAKLKLNDMLQNGYFAHTTPQGKTPWDWFDKAGYKYKLAGENLAMDFIFSRDVVDAWMTSESHRKNILYKDFKEIGVAVGTGNINGRETVAIVEVFGSPVEKKTVTPPPIKTAAKSIAVAKVLPKVTPAPSVPPPTTPTPVVTKLKAAPISLAKEVVQALASVKGDISEKTSETVSKTSNWALVFLAGVAVIILLLKIFVSFRIQFPVLIVRAALLVVISLWLASSGPEAFDDRDVIITKVAEFSNTIGIR